MKGFILGAKKDQSQTFTENGERIPVTHISTAPCYVVGITNAERQGYTAVKLGFGTTNNLKKPVQGELKKAGIKAPLRFLREFRVTPEDITEEDGKKSLTFGEVKVGIGEEIKPSVVFKAGDKIDVTGTSKGKGFQGVVKRHGFGGGPKTHGQSDRWRAPGSIGSGTTPGRINKGKRMAGRMGGDRVTVKGLEVVSVSDNEIIVKGLIPGHRSGLVQVIAE